MFDDKRRLFLLKKIVLLMILIFMTCLPQHLSAQEEALRNAAPVFSKLVETSFTESDVELTKNSVVNNVLRITNKTKNTIRFTVDFAAPPEWKLIGGDGNSYELNSMDSIFIPLRLVPTTIIKGNTHFTVNAFLVSEDGIQLNDAFFFIHLKKIIKWDLNIGPSEKIYFLHNQKTANFNLNMINMGNEREEIHLLTTSTGNNILITDTNDHIFTKNYHTLNLKARGDSTLYFKLNYTEGIQRNTKRVDVDNFVPFSSLEERKYTVFVQAEQPVSSSTAIYKIRKRVTFVHLSNKKKVNTYGSFAIPLVVETFISNLFGNQPIMNLTLRGRSELADNSYITYFSQTQFDSYFFNGNSLANNIFNIGYYCTKGNIQIGNVGGYGMPVNGKGISGNYVFTKSLNIGAFITAEPSIFNPSRKIAFGVSPSFKLFNTLTIYTQYGRGIDRYTNSTSDYYNVRTSFTLLKKLQFNTGVSNTQSSLASAYFPIGTTGYLNYTGRFLKNKLQTNINTQYRDQKISTTNFKTTNLSGRLNYTINKKYSTAYQSSFSENQYSYNRIGISAQNANSLFANQLMLTRNMGTERLTGSLLYNSTSLNGILTHSKGAGLDFGHSEPSSTFRYGINLKGAYNNYVFIKNSPEFFTFQVNSFAQYHTISMRAYYMYGPQNISDTTILSSTLSYPQSAYINLQYQYQFANPRLVLQSGLSYTYDTRNSRSFFGIYPELHYAAPNGWHFRALVSYNYSSSNFQYSSPAITGSSETTNTQTGNSTYNISVGIRKEFNIPVPSRFSKKKYTDIEFIAFYDVNGNHIQDFGELPLENIVIRLDNNDEIITDENGKATFKNVEAGNHPLTTFSLVDLKGWFSWLGDTLVVGNQKVQYVPYVKGVKIYGNVIIERTKYASDLEKPLDLSGIKITATDGISLETRTGLDGQFVMYAPYGTYILTMDESILGRRYSMGKNNIKIVLTEGMESLYNSFYIIEKRRNESKVKFNSKGEVIEDDGNGKTTPDKKDKNH